MQIFYENALLFHFGTLITEGDTNGGPQNNSTSTVKECCITASLYVSRLT